MDIWTDVPGMFSFRAALKQRGCKTFAPVEAILEAGILILAGLLLPLHQITVFLFVTHMIARNVVGHAGIELFPSWWLKAPLLRWITTTTHHDLHHSNGASNFGLYFTWWDKWMNTEHPEYATHFIAATRSPHPSALSIEGSTDEL